MDRHIHQNNNNHVRCDSGRCGAHTHHGRRSRHHHHYKYMSWPYYRPYDDNQWLYVNNYNYGMNRMGYYYYY